MSLADSVWAEVYARLRDDIEKGKMPQGSDCPSEEDLQEQFKDYSRGTIRRALSQLVRENYLEIRPGKRRVIRKPDSVAHIMFPLEHRGFGRDLLRIAKEQNWAQELWPSDEVIFPPKSEVWYHIKESRLPTELIKTAFGFQTERIATGDEEEVIWLLRARMARGRPLVLQWAVVPRTVIGKIPMESLVPGGLTSVYHDRGIHRHSYQSTFIATRASSDEGRYLRVETGTPLIAERRISYHLPGTSDDSGPQTNEAMEYIQAYELLVTLYTDRVTLDYSSSPTQDHPAPRSNPKGKTSGSSKK